MKILLAVHQFFPHHRHGVEHSTLELARAQLAKGHRLHIAAGERGRLTRELSFERDRYEELPVTRIYFNPRAPGGFLAHPVFADRWKRLLDELQPDLVHVQHLQNLSLSLLAATASAGVALVFTLRDFSLLCARQFLMRGDGSFCAETHLFDDCLACVHYHEPISRTSRFCGFADTVAANAFSARSWRLAGEALLRRAGGRDAPPIPYRDEADFRRRNEAVVSALQAPDAITAISTPLARRMEELVRVAGGGISITPLPQAPDLTRFRRRVRSAREGRPLRFGFIGKLARLKGVDLLVRAFSRLPQGRAELHIHGDATRTDIREMAFARRIRAALARTPGAHLHPAVGAEQLPRLLDELDVIVTPSVCFEGYHRVTAEALASGAPVVCGDRGGPSELVRHELNGLQFPIGDERALASALRRFLDEPGLLASLSGHAAAPKSHERYVDELLALYHHVIERRQERANR